MLFWTHILFSVQICLTRVGLGETLEQFPAIAGTNSLSFHLDLIYCCHFIPFSVANILLDRSKYQLFISDFSVKNFCVKTEIFWHFGCVLQHFQQAFVCCFLQVHTRKEGETLLKSFKKTSPRNPFGWVAISLLFSLYFQFFFHYFILLDP